MADVSDKTLSEQARELAGERRSLRDNDVWTWCTRAARKIRALADENDRLRADKRRLDWLERDSYEGEQDLRGNWWRVWSVGLREPTECESVRAAIDAAMKGDGDE